MVISRVPSGTQTIYWLKETIVLLSYWQFLLILTDFKWTNHYISYYVLKICFICAFLTKNTVVSLSFSANIESHNGICFFGFLFFWGFLERGEWRRRNIHVWLPLGRPFLGTWPATQACALTGNRTGDSLVCRPALNPLSHTSQGSICNF